MDGASAPAPASVTMNRSELAQFFEVSEPTIDAWVRKGMPFLEEGTNGRPYKFDPQACRAWRAAIEAARLAQEQAKAQLIAEQQAMEPGLPLGDEPDPSLTRITLDDQLKIRRIAVEDHKARQQRGELMEKAAVESQFEMLFSFLAQALEGFPDQLQRRLGLSLIQTRTIREITDGWREDLARRLMQAEPAGDDSRAA